MQDKDKVIYEEMKENLVDINMQRQRILETIKKIKQTYENFRKKC